MTKTIHDDFDLEKIANSGQCFRWKQVDNAYRIIAMDDCLYVKHLGGEEYEFDCDEETFAGRWHNYFALDDDLGSIRQRIPGQKDPFLQTAATEETGIRILRQDPWEMLISFIISQNRNIPAIKKSIERLSEAAGRKKKDSRGEEYYTFPTPKALLQLSGKELADCRLGYRAEYILAAAKAVVDKTINLKRLLNVSCAEAVEELMKIKGVGEKVASCVALFGLHQLDAFPEDVWMKKIIKNEYKECYPKEEYSPYNGVYQQYMFAYYRRREDEYKILCKKLHALTDGVPHRISNLANAAALLWQEMDNINWAGFYLLEKDKLILGPFQGKPACIEIETGKGVCGTAVATRKTQVVADVHVFPGHIACDSASLSEIVVPLYDKDGDLFGVLDIDSPVPGRFSDIDKEWLEKFVGILQ